jgi:hypothetical protein
MWISVGLMIFRAYSDIHRRPRKLSHLYLCLCNRWPTIGNVRNVPYIFGAGPRRKTICIVNQCPIQHSSITFHHIQAGYNYRIGTLPSHCVRCATSSIDLPTPREFPIDIFRSPYFSSFCWFFGFKRSMEERITLWKILSSSLIPRNITHDYASKCYAEARYPCLMGRDTKYKGSPLGNGVLR